MIETKSKFLPGWTWIHFEDGSGSLKDSNGKDYLSYDLWTREYKILNNKWNFFPTYPDHMSREDFITYIEGKILENEN